MCRTETLVAAGGHQLECTSPDDVPFILLLSINNKVQHETVSEEHVMYVWFCNTENNKTSISTAY